MKIQDVMTRNPESVTPETDLTDCARKMKSLDVGVMPVLEGDRPVGIITDRDIVIRGIADGHNPRDIQVRDCMTGEVATCFLDDDVQQAARLMQQKQIRRLLVLDRNNQKLAGIVSLGDLATDVKLRGIPEKTLERISQPSEPRRKVA